MAVVTPPWLVRVPSDLSPLHTKPTCSNIGMDPLHSSTVPYVQYIRSGLYSFLSLFRIGNQTVPRYYVLFCSALVSIISPAVSRFLAHGSTKV